MQSIYSAGFIKNIRNILILFFAAATSCHLLPFSRNNYSLSVKWIIFNNSFDTVALSFMLDTIIPPAGSQVVSANIFDYSMEPDNQSTYRIASLDSIIVKVNYNWHTDELVSQMNFGKLKLFISGKALDPNNDTLEAMINMEKYFILSGTHGRDEYYFDPRHDMIDTLFLII